MTFFSSSVPAPVTVPEGSVSEKSVYTGTACLTFIDAAVTEEVWEDLLYDGVDHDHGAGGIMLNSAAVGTHLEHDGDFPVKIVTNDAGEVLAFGVNLDPYAEDLSDVRHLDLHGDGHGHEHPHSHGDGHVHTHLHGHDDSHGHEDDEVHGHGDGWSNPALVALESAHAVFGDPAGLPEADDTGGLLDFTFPAAEGTLAVTVYTEHGLRRELVAVWST